MLLRKISGRSFSFKSKTNNIWIFQCLRLPRTVLRRFPKNACHWELMDASLASTVCLSWLVLVLETRQIFNVLKIVSIFIRRFSTKKFEKIRSTDEWRTSRFWRSQWNICEKRKNVGARIEYLFWNVVGKFSMVLKKICEKSLQALQKSFTENFHVAWKFLFGYAATDNLACLTRKIQALILRKLRKSWS